MSHCFIIFFFNFYGKNLISSFSDFKMKKHKVECDLKWRTWDTFLSYFVLLAF